MNQDEKNLFSRRAVILGLGQGLLVSALVGRLGYLQIVSNEHYQTLSDKNRIHTHFLTPLRGVIQDRHGSLLATNQKTFSAYVIRDQVESWESLLTRLSPILSLSENEKEKITQTLHRNPKFMPTLVKHSLSWQEVSSLEIHLPDLPGLVIEEEESRRYPKMMSLAHVIGYVGMPTDQDVNTDPTLATPALRVGKTGLEKAYDATLQGKPGIKQLEVNARRHVIRELSKQPSQPGANLTLTLDTRLQEGAYSLLEPHESGVVIILDCETGAILALTSYPGYDINPFVNGIRHQAWQELLDHPRRPLHNKAVSGVYPPGSTFKMMVALAALGLKAIDEKTTVTCRGSVELGTHHFHCHAWRQEGHGPVNLHQAIRGSCDVFFYHIAQLIGVDAIAAMATQFGFGQPTGIDLPGEKSGLVPSRDWKRRLLRSPWHLGETYNTAIGQGYVLATPIQLVTMMAGLANRTHLPRPHFMAQNLTKTPLVVDPGHLSLIHNGLVAVANEPGGSAYAKRITQPGFEMAGKTGTSQVRRITLKDRRLGLVNRADRPWEHKEHSLFVGYAPIQAPKYAICVLVEHGSSSKIAVPIARDLLLLAQGKDLDETLPL